MVPADSHQIFIRYRGMDDCWTDPANLSDPVSDNNRNGKDQITADRHDHCGSIRGSGHGV